jgi:pteridine reductase
MKKTGHSTALITGATSPIGMAIVHAFAGEGLNILVHYNRSEKQALKLCAELEKKKVKAWPVKADFRGEGEAESLVKQAEKLAGTIDILVNNASIYTRSNIDKVTYGDLSGNMLVNAWTPLVLGRALRKTGRGRCMVNILDSRITGGDAEHTGYIISKTVLETMTRMMALEFAPAVRVNGVAPGLVLTKQSAGQKYRALAGSLPLKRYCSPDDVAEAVLFLIRSDLITGQIIYVDGGRHIRK